MADRMPGFPMHPTGFNPAGIARPPQMMLGQQQGQQQTDGGSTDRHFQLTPQQIIHLSHMQQQRQQQPQTNDLLLGSNNPGGQPQMGDFARQQLPHMPGLGQSSGMHPQTSFNSGQTSAVGGSDPQSQQILRTPNMQTLSIGGQQPNQQQFMPSGGTNAAALQAAFQQQRASLMFQNQLERLQSGNPAAAAAGRMNLIPGQPRLQQFASAGMGMQPNPATFNPNPTLLGGVSPFPNGAQPGQSNRDPQAELPPATMQQVQAKMVSLRQWIEAGESSIAQLNSARASMPDAVFQERNSRMRTEVQEKKSMYQRLNQMANAHRGTQNPAMLGGMLQQMQGTQAQAQVQAQAQAQAQQAQAQAQVQAQAQAQTGLQSSGIWPPGASRPNPAFSPSLGATAANQHSAGMPSAGSTTIDNQNLKPRPPMPPGNLAQPADSHGNRGSVGFSGQPGLGDLDASKGAAAAPPPISAEEFQRVYLNFCQTNKIQHDERLMFVEGRRVDLYRLHSEVASAGGYAVVAQKEDWHIIGGKLGFIQFHGAAPMCGPALAEKLHHIYREYLLHFDNMYAQQWRTRRRAVNSQQINMMARFAYTSVEGMRAAGVGDELIRMVESHRAKLQGFVKQQKEFSNSVLRGQGAHNQGEVPSLGNISGTPPLGHARTLSNPNGIPAPSMTAPLTGSSQPNSTQQQEVIVITADDVRTTKALLQTQKLAFLQQRGIAAKNFDIPLEQRPKFAQLLALLNERMNILDQRSPAIYQYVKNIPSLLDEWKKIVGIMACAQLQHSFLQPNTAPRYVVEMSTLHSMSVWSQRCSDHIMESMNKAVRFVFPPGPGAPTASAAQPPNASPALQTPQLPPNPSHAAPLQAPPMSGRRKASLSKAGSSPATGGPVSTPMASVSSPAATPVNAPSPRTPKSPPKSKAPKAKQAKAPAPGKSSPAPQPSSAVSTPGTKRVREDEVEPASEPSLVSPAPAQVPSPKRQKMGDWSGPVSEDVLQRQKDFDPNQTTEEAAAVLDKMMDLFQATDAPTSFDLEDTLAQILSGCVGGPASLMGDASTSVLASEGTGRLVSPTLESTDNPFSAFIDLAQYSTSDDQLGPGLSTSTNPSPASDAVTNTPKLSTAVKTEPSIVAPMASIAPDDDDPFRMGTWSEIGAEANYWQPNDGWKWTGTIPQADWAIHQS